MSNFPRLIENAFPLEATSIDSVHEKNVRHGHISTLHIWPARRPLAACRAALIATLLPDPGTAEGRRELCEKIAGKVVKKIERKKMPNGQIVERVKKETEGGILHWGRETENAETLQWFRDEIRKAYGGRAPKVLDPFSGGGAIPLEAMRLGCEATAVDINPVAWFILKCTLEYPQKLAGQTRPLPEFILHNDEFMTDFFKKAKSYSKMEIRAALTKLHERLKKRKKWNDNSQPQKTFHFVNEGAEDEGELQADLAWHVRAWGQWVLQRARRDLAKYYPTYADFEPVKKDVIPYEPLPMRLLPVRDDGTADIDSLNSEFSEDYLSVKGNPRWIAKPTVAYLWARTIKCKNCTAVVPMLKTKWLCKKKSGNRQRTLLEINPKADKTGVEFGVISNVPTKGRTAALNREHDKVIGQGTMSKAGVKCPCCSTIMDSEYIRFEASRNATGHMPIIVAVDGIASKEFRTLTKQELFSIENASSDVSEIMSRLPDGDLREATPKGGGTKASRAFSLHTYGMTEWRDLFTDRQRLSLATLAIATLEAHENVKRCGLNESWQEAITAYLTCGFERLVDFANVNVQWKIDVPTINHSLVRFAIQVTWDFAEGNPIGVMAGSYIKCLERVAVGIDTLCLLPADLPPPKILRQSSTNALPNADIILTDPPYYDAIPYSDLMDWFYVWLRRVGVGIGSEYKEVMASQLGPKWNPETQDGELIDDDMRHGGDAVASKRAYEDGMTSVFMRCHESLSKDGRLVIVFANKQPDAWETLVASVIRAGFIVDGSWPIRTEQPSRMRGISSAALASSVWLVCKKRPSTAKPGWDNKVLEEMRTKIALQLHEFWDAGIRGPDFVWAATGPAMEAYSKFPVVRKALVDGEVMTVGEFLTHVRRMVVDYVVGQVLTGAKEKETVAADRLDEVTAYYLLHRYDFQMEEAPIGACILYATACGLSDSELERTWDILVRGSTSSDSDVDDDEENDQDEDDPDVEASGSGSKVKLKSWDRRTNRSMGFEAPEGRPVPLVDRIHRVMHLWKSGEVQKVDEYLDEHGLRRNELFKRVVQSLIELSTNGERSLLESISNHIGAKGAIADRGPLLAFEFEEDK
jgi:putative DNA methylase